MPKDNIERGIKKGVGDTDDSNYFELTYEGYGPGGVAIMVEALTDNKNRTAADVRSIFSKRGGNLGETGCVSYMFHKKGIISIPIGPDEDQVMEVALEAGAEDVQVESEGYTVLTEPQDVENVEAALVAAGITVESSTVSMVPENTVEVDADHAEKVMKLLELLDDHDDVQEVSSNVDFPEGFGD